MTSEAVCGDFKKLEKFSSNETYHDESYPNDQWLRKATGAECEMEEVYLTGHRLWYQLDLSSLEPLQEDHARKALEHFYRKAPNMAVTFAWRDEELWVKRTTKKPIFDFKVIQDQTVEEVRAYLHKYHFNDETAPTFCCRLLPDKMLDAARVDDLEPCFTHKYHLLFGIRHALTDGTATMTLMGHFIKILNDVISDTPVNDDIPLGRFLSDDETQRLVLEKKTLVEAEPKLQQQLQKEMEYKRERRPIVLKLSRKPKLPKRTASMFTILDQTTTCSFVEKCHCEKVTVNAMMTALANRAIVETLVEEGVHEAVYIIQTFHAINLRRYWNGDVSNTLGYHTSFPLILNYETPQDLQKCFWEYAKYCNARLKEDVVSGKILQNDAYKMTMHTSEDESHYGQLRDYEGDYVTSSMGDVTKLVTSGGQHVRITNVFRSTGIHGTEFPLLFNYHTFRNRFWLGFDYNTDVLEATTAEKIYSKIVMHMKQLVS